MTDWIRHGGRQVGLVVEERRARVQESGTATVNNDKDMDEEWVIEMAVPFESIGLEGKPGERIGFSVHRCDTPKGGRRVCGIVRRGAGRRGARARLSSRRAAAALPQLRPEIRAT